MNIDLNSIIPGAPNFKYREFIKSDVAIRKGISNIPTNKNQWRNIEILARNILQPVRTKFGPIRITSGFRSAELNKAINGNIKSNHCIGQAADIEPLKNGIAPLDILCWIHYNLGYRELIAEYLPEGWVHVAYRRGDNNKQLKIKDKKHNFNRGDIKQIKNLYA